MLIRVPQQTLLTKTSRKSEENNLVSSVLVSGRYCNFSMLKIFLYLDEKSYAMLLLEVLLVLFDALGKLHNNNADDDELIRKGSFPSSIHPSVTSRKIEHISNACMEMLI